ncbi:hypothetical protein D9M68_684840 [compost metagenome]
MNILGSLIPARRKALLRLSKLALIDAATVTAAYRDVDTLVLRIQGSGLIRLNRTERGGRTVEETIDMIETAARRAA